MYEAIRNPAADRRFARRSAAGTGLSALLAAGCLTLGPAAHAQDADPAARDLTVEQAAVYTVAAPAPAASPERLDVVAWVDHADNTYAVGETVRLFVKASKDAYLTVLNVGASGRTTILLPNAHQPETRVPANQVVEVPPPDSGTRIQVGGPTGRELIKVVATTHPTPLFAAMKTTAAGPYKTLEADTRSVARDLQVVMNDAEADQEWDEYNKVITTIAARPAAVVPMAPAPSGTAWPAAPFGLQLAVGKPVYRMGEPVSLYASAEVPCYLTLVNVGSSGQVRVLLPNAAQPRNLLPAGQTVVFPVAGSNLELTPVGPAGVETVVAVCSTDNQPVFPSGLAYGQGGFAALGDGREAVTRDLSVVASGPSRRIGQATVGFVVTQ